MTMFISPDTGELHRRCHTELHRRCHTEAHLDTIKYHNTMIENTIVFNRVDSTQVNLCVDHFHNTHEVTLAVFNTEHGDPTTIHEQITLSYQEARLLRDLLNRPEVAQYLEQDFH